MKDLTGEWKVFQCRPPPTCFLYPGSRSESCYSSVTEKGRISLLVKNELFVMVFLTVVHFV